MKPNCYIAAPFRLARFIDEVVRAKVEARGLSVRSRWHLPPYPDKPERLSSLPLAVIDAAIANNDQDVMGSDLGLVLLDEDAGETACELRMMTIVEIPVVVVGTREILSCYRHGVRRCVTLDCGVDALVQLGEELRQRVVERAQLMAMP